MKHYIPLLLLPLLWLSACSGPLDKPITDKVDGQVDPIKSADQLFEEIKPSIDLLYGGLNASAKHLEPTITDGSRREVVNKIQQEVVRLSALPNGAEALKRLGYAIQEIARQARDAERWHLVMACVDAFEVLSMDSYLLEKLDERARAILEQPKVEVKGYFHDQNTDERFVFLQLTNRLTQEVTKERVREGEEVQNLRVVEIIGRNRGVKLEFTKIEGLYFTVGSFGNEIDERFNQS